MSATSQARSDRAHALREASRLRRLLSEPNLTSSRSAYWIRAIRELLNEAYDTIEQTNQMPDEPTHKPEEYRHIRAWGKLMQSFSYYITAQQEEAAADNAPLDAIYKDSNGVWVRATDCVPSVQGDIAHMLAANL